MSNEHIKQEMERLGITQTDLGELLGRSQGSMSNLFAPNTDRRYRPLKPDEALKIAAKMGKSVLWVLYGTDSPDLNMLVDRISALEVAVVRTQSELDNLDKTVAEMGEEFSIKLKKKKDRTINLNA